MKALQHAFLSGCCGLVAFKLRGSFVLYFFLTMSQLVCAQSSKSTNLPAKTGQPAPTSPQTGRPAESSAARMLITGDREAPLILSIIPWSEPKMTALPEVPLYPLLPIVFDGAVNLVDEPGNRQQNAVGGKAEKR